MARRRRTVKQRQEWAHLDFQQWFALVAGCGFETAFGSLEDTQSAWEANRRELMSLHVNDPRGHAGRRPWAWWIFDQGEEPDFGTGEAGASAEADRLNALGKLRTEELSALAERKARYEEVDDDENQ